MKNVYVGYTNNYKKILFIILFITYLIFHIDCINIFYSLSLILSYTD